ncbi:DNA-binding transcriptional repressor ArsR [Escherichia coli]|uniref:Arsenical resistance operon repressor n=1 Tax=Escherichia coli TaxID=562 RepID=A0A376MKA5_ECOLX|nr:DNA-binding transcriptional repressor ArsR [Escherichia coli]
MFLTYPLRRETLPATIRSAICHFCYPSNCSKILADETRLGIVLLLSELGELCVCDLCTALDQSQPKISRHLALLRESGLLLDRKQGKWVHYRLSPHIPSWAAKIIEQAWRCEQEKVQVIVRNLARQNFSVDSKNICS